MQFLTLSAAVCLCALASAQPQFQEGPVLSGGTAALLEAVGDFNNDGAPDIAAIAGNSVIIYLSADSQFSQTEVPVGCAVTAIAAGHFSGIGPAGVAFACAGSATVGLISQTGSGFAVTGTTSAANGSLISLGVGDLNSDGIDDLVVPGGVTALNSKGANLIGSPGLLAVYGKGDGTFQAPVVIDPAISAIAAVVADFNQDGHPDLVVCSYVGKLNTPLQIYLNNGDGTFTPGPLAGTALVLPWALATGDVNGDGIPDLLVSSYSKGGPEGVEVQLGDGHGGFTALPPQTALTLAATFADTRGTGVLDIVTSGEATTATKELPPSGALVLPGNGDGTFGAPVPFSFGTGCFLGISAADFNGDGKDDFAVNCSSTNGSATLTAWLESGTTGPATSIAVELSTAALQFRNQLSAGFASGAMARGSIVAAFRTSTDLAQKTDQAKSLPLPQTLGGASISVKDSAGVTRPAAMFYADQHQLNYEIPDDMQTGPATITINTGSTTLTQTQQIVPVSPGLYAVPGASGASLAAAVSVLVASDGKQTRALAVGGGSGGVFQPVPIDLGSGSDKVFLELYGTGLRHHVAPVIVNIGGQIMTPIYASQQGTYAGEDQIDVQIPTVLRGAGTVQVVVTVDGHQTNAVEVQIK